MTGFGWELQSITKTAPNVFHIMVGRPNRAVRFITSPDGVIAGGLDGHPAPVFTRMSLPQARDAVVDWLHTINQDEQP